MKIKKFALAFLLVLHCGGVGGGAFTSALSLPARPLAHDGVNRDAGKARSGGGGQRKPRAAATRRGKRAPVVKANADAAKEIVPVTEIDGEGLKKLLSRGDDAEVARPLLLNFWATWCVPCRKEFPDLVKIGTDYNGRAIEFALVSADDVSELKTTVPKFLREMRAATMPAYLLNATDTEAAIAQVDPAWGGELPATFLFDRQGKLAYKHFGIIDAGKLRAEINKVMGDE